MKTTSHNLAQDMVLLYDEPVSETEASIMADRLLNFVDLLLEIESESVETP